MRTRGCGHSLRALRTAAARTGKEVLVLAPTGKPVDEALHDDAGDRGYTLAKALHLLQSGALTLDRHCVIVVDEASVVATPDLLTLLTEASKARVKTVLVGDPYQLSPVKARWPFRVPRARRADSPGVPYLLFPQHPYFIMTRPAPVREQYVRRLARAIEWGLRR